MLEQYSYLTNATRPPIDIHSHFNHGSPFDCRETEEHLRSFEFLRSVYQKAGIKSVGFSSYASVLKHCECIIEENEYMHRLAKNEDWIYQWVVVDPRQKETYRQAEIMLPHPKVLGIKIHPSYHGYDIMEHGDELFGFANEHEAVVLMHPQHVSEMPLFADKYPDMKLIIAHLGSMEQIKAITSARHGNIYTDTSAGGLGLNNILEAAVKYAGSEKILFGTDTYAYSYEFARVAFAELSFEDKENIFWRNAVRLFGKDFQ